MIFVCLVAATTILAAQDSKRHDPKLPTPPQQATRACSVPLLNLHVDHPGKFAIRVARAPHKDPMPRPVAPAPPCDKSNQNSTK